MANALDMPPIFPGRDAVNCCLAHSVMFGQFPLRNFKSLIKFPDLPNFTLLKLGAAMIFALAWWNSILFERIPHILCVGASKKMFQVVARRIIAVVANLFPLGYWPILEHPHQPVNPPQLRLVSHHAVPPISFVSGPDPAFRARSLNCHRFKELENLMACSWLPATRAIFKLKHDLLRLFGLCSPVNCYA